MERTPKPGSARMVPVRPDPLEDWRDSVSFRRSIGTIQLPKVQEKDCGDQQTHRDPEPMIKTFLRIAIEPRGQARGLQPVDPMALGDGQGVVQEMKENSRQEAAAADRQQSQHDAEQGRIEKLLEQAQEHMQEPEHQRREEDRRPRPMLVFEPRENKTAEGKLLA